MSGQTREIRKQIKKYIHSELHKSGTSSMTLVLLYDLTTLARYCNRP